MKRNIVLILLLYEIGIFLYGWITKAPGYSAIPAWVWAFTFGFMVLLVAWQKKDNFLPFPFLQPLTDAGLWISLVAVFGVYVAVSIVLILLHVPPLSSYLGVGISYQVVSSLALSFHAGISEESIKIVITNFVKVTKKSREPKFRKIYVWASGTAAVFAWAIMHYVVGYPVAYVVATVPIGMVMFVVIYKYQNYLPVVLVHSLWDFHYTLGKLGLLLSIFPLTHG